MFFVFLYLPCYVVAEYPKEEGWAHTCVSRGMERDVVLIFVFVPPKDEKSWAHTCIRGMGVFFGFVSAMLCRGRVPQLGEEPGLPAHVSAEGLKLCVCVCVCACYVVS